MWNFLWTSDLFYHKLAIFREEELWEVKIEEKDKLARRDMYLAKAEKQNFLLLSSGQRVFCSETFVTGQEKIVQVIQEEKGEKLAEVSQKLELRGKFFVYFPLEQGLGISKKIVEQEERERLRELVSLYQGEGNFLIRTEAQGQKTEILEEELRSLLEAWKEVQENAFQKRKKGKLHENHSWIEEVLEKYGHEDWGFCYTEAFEPLAFLEKKLTFYQKEGREYHGDISLWEEKQMDTKLNHLCQSRVDLEEGVYLFLERTQACISIDVNRLKGKVKLANEIAAREIPKQLRLRNWSGIVVIDFIDGKEEDKKDLMTILREGFAREAGEIGWGGFQNFYLCIFTKQRKGQEMEHYFERESQAWKIQSLENELLSLMEKGEKKFCITGEKKLIQEWKKRTQCGIKDSIEFVESKAEKDYQIQIQK